MTKKIAVIGKGTAGSQGVAHFLRWLPDAEIEWYFDSTKPTQSVGEGSTLHLPRNLQENLGFSHSDLQMIDGTFKHGIRKVGYTDKQSDFYHNFPSTNVSYHFSAIALQDYVLDKVRGRVKMVDTEVKCPDDIDADYIYNCSGHDDSEQYIKSKCIPVNSAIIRNASWDNPSFSYTYTEAREHGWIFCIPLQKRQSIGYLYNSTITNYMDVVKDLDDFFNERSLSEPLSEKQYNFLNYYREYNCDGRQVYSGNSSFFLEPTEATSIGTMDFCQRSFIDLVNGDGTTQNVDAINSAYNKLMKQIENVIALHYLNNNHFESEFWQYAKKISSNHHENSMTNDVVFSDIIKSCVANHDSSKSLGQGEYGLWGYESFRQNVNGLKIKQ